MEWIAHLLTLFVLEPMSANGLYKQADWNMKELFKKSRTVRVLIDRYNLENLK